MNEREGIGMSRGIWGNSLLKIFLTQGPLGSIFRPILYSREEQIHFSFMAPLLLTAAEIRAITDYRKRSIAYYWLCEVPRNIFEEIFLPDETGCKLCNFLNYAKTGNAENLAYLTQGYVLSYYERILKSDQCFHEMVDISVAELENLARPACGDAKIISKYRNIFNKQAGEDEVDGFKIHHFYAQELLQTINPSQSSIGIITNESFQFNKLLLFGPRKLRNAKQNTMLLCEAINEAVDSLSPEGLQHSNKRNYVEK